MKIEKLTSAKEIEPYDVVEVLIERRTWMDYSTVREGEQGLAFNVLKSSQYRLRRQVGASVRYFQRQPEE